MGTSGPKPARGPRGPGRVFGSSWQLVASFWTAKIRNLADSGRVPARNDRSLGGATQPIRTAGRGDRVRSNRSKTYEVDRIGRSAGMRRSSGSGSSVSRLSARGPARGSRSSITSSARGRRRRQGFDTTVRAGRARIFTAPVSTDRGCRGELVGCADGCSARPTLQNLRNPGAENLGKDVVGWMDGTHRSQSPPRASSKTTILGLKRTDKTDKTPERRASRPTSGFGITVPDRGGPSRMAVIRPDRWG
jgi:hypothetical protein